MEAKSGNEDAVEEFLLSALPLVEQEPGTKPWFAVRFGPSTFGIIDAFPDEAARETHLGGPVGKALAEQADELFASPPDISNLDVIANKLWLCDLSLQHVKANRPRFCTCYKPRTRD